MRPLLRTCSHAMAFSRGREVNVVTVSIASSEGRTAMAGSTAYSKAPTTCAIRVHSIRSAFKVCRVTIEAIRIYKEVVLIYLYEAEQSVVILRQRIYVHKVVSLAEYQ